MITTEIKIHCIAIDGYPDMDKLMGRVAFIFDGCIVSGWPIRTGGGGGGDDNGNDGEGGDNDDAHWEANEDVGRHGDFAGVTHWVEFPVPVWKLESNWN